MTLIHILVFDKQIKKLKSRFPDLCLIFMTPDLFLSFQIWYQNFTYYSCNNATGVLLRCNMISDLIIFLNNTRIIFCIGSCIDWEVPYPFGHLPCL